MLFSNKPVTMEDKKRKSGRNCISFQKFLAQRKSDAKSGVNVDFINGLYNTFENNITTLQSQIASFIKSTESKFRIDESRSVIEALSEDNQAKLNEYLKSYRLDDKPQNEGMTYSGAGGKKLQIAKSVKVSKGLDEILAEAQTNLPENRNVLEWWKYVNNPNFTLPEFIAGKTKFPPLAEFKYYKASALEASKKIKNEPKFEVIWTHWKSNATKTLEGVNKDWDKEVITVWKSYFDSVVHIRLYNKYLDAFRTFFTCIQTLVSCLTPDLWYPNDNDKISPPAIGLAAVPDTSTPQAAHSNVTVDGSEWPESVSNWYNDTTSDLRDKQVLVSIVAQNATKNPFAAFCYFPKWKRPNHTDVIVRNKETLWVYFWDKSNNGGKIKFWLCVSLDKSQIDKQNEPLQSKILDTLTQMGNALIGNPLRLLFELLSTLRRWIKEALISMINQRTGNSDLSRKFANYLEIIIIGGTLAILPFLIKPSEYPEYARWILHLATKYSKYLRLFYSLRGLYSVLHWWNMFNSSPLTSWRKFVEIMYNLTRWEVWKELGRRLGAPIAGLLFSYFKESDNLKRLITEWGAGFLGSLRPTEKPTTQQQIENPVFANYMCDINKVSPPNITNRTETQLSEGKSAFLASCGTFTHSNETKTLNNILASVSEESIKNNFSNYTFWMRFNFKKDTFPNKQSEEYKWMKNILRTANTEEHSPGFLMGLLNLYNPNKEIFGREIGGTQPISNMANLQRSLGSAEVTGGSWYNRVLANLRVASPTDNSGTNTLGTPTPAAAPKGQRATITGQGQAQQQL